MHSSILGRLKTAAVFMILLHQRLENRTQQKQSALQVAVSLLTPQSLAKTVSPFALRFDRSG